MPRSHAAPFDPLIAQRTMIAKTESSVFLTGRPAKPADLPNRPTCQTGLQLAELLIYMPYAQRFWGLESGYCSPETVVPDTAMLSNHPCTRTTRTRAHIRV